MVTSRPPREAEPFTRFNNASLRRSEALVPNPKLRLREQVREVMRYCHYSIRTEEAYWHWICRHILFHAKRHSGEMGAQEVTVFLSHFASAEEVAQPPGIER